MNKLQGPVGGRLSASRPEVEIVARTPWKPNELTVSRVLEHVFGREYVTRVRAHSKRAYKQLRGTLYVAVVEPEGAVGAWIMEKHQHGDELRVRACHESLAVREQLPCRCPPSVIDKLTVTSNADASAWRVKCRAQALIHENIRSLRSGAIRVGREVLYDYALATPAMRRAPIEMMQRAKELDEVLEGQRPCEISEEDETLASATLALQRKICRELHARSRAQELIRKKLPTRLASEREAQEIDALMEIARTSKRSARMREKAALTRAPVYLVTPAGAARLTLSASGDIDVAAQNSTARGYVTEEFLRIRRILSSGSR